MLWEGNSPNRPFCAAVLGAIGALVGSYFGLIGLIVGGFGLLIAAAIWGEKAGQWLIHLIGTPLMVLFGKVSTSKRSITNLLYS